MIRCGRGGRRVQGAVKEAVKGKDNLHNFSELDSVGSRDRRVRYYKKEHVRGGAARASEHPCPPLTRTLRLAVRDIGALPLGVVLWTIPQMRIWGQRSWRLPTLERRRSSKDFACESQVHGAWCTSRASVALGPAPHQCTELTARPSSLALVCVQRLDEHVGCCPGADSLARRRLG